MPPVSERLRAQFNKMVKAICRTMDLRLNGDQGKISRYFDEYNHNPELPEGTKLTSRFDTIEKSIEDQGRDFQFRENKILSQVESWNNRSWWRRFWGLRPKKQKAKKPRDGRYCCEGLRPSSPRPQK